MFKFNSLNPFFGRIEQERDLFRLLNWIVVRGTWYPFLFWYTWHILSISFSLCKLFCIFNWIWFVSQIVSSTKTFQEILGGPRLHLYWSQRSNRQTKSILVVFDIYLTSQCVIIPWLVKVLFSLYFLNWLKISFNIILTWAWKNILFLIWSRMWIVKVHSHNFFRHWILELPCSHIPLFMNNIKTVSFVICTWSRLQLIFNKFSCVFLWIPVSYRLEYTLSSWNWFLLWFWVIVANTWIWLLEVDIYSYCFNKVKWVFLVEWETEFTLRIELWNIYVLLYGHWIILSGTNI